MLARLAVAIIAIAATACGTADAACPDRGARDCVDLHFVPQFAPQMAVGQHLSAPAKPASLSDPDTSYTGPTLGVAPRLRQAPEVGYRWAIN